MNILRIIFEGYNSNEGRFADCVLFLRENEFSISNVYAISEKHLYPICSEVTVDKLVEAKCLEGPQEIIEAYNIAKSQGYYFIHFQNVGSVQMNPFTVPRFDEDDFRIIIEKIGGQKILESNTKTPDFILDKTLIELKDIQTDSLFNRDRQKSLGEIFKNQKGYCVNLDPTLNYGELTSKYHKLIANTISNHVKKASEQIKVYSEGKAVNAAGMILMNTGMFSLPHDLLKAIATNIIENQTRTIQFMLLFTQKMQTNGLDLYANFANDFIGDVPDNILILKETTKEYINSRMTDMMRGVNILKTVESQHPISFSQNEKVFYWNPGKVTGDLTSQFEKKDN